MSDTEDQRRFLSQTKFEIEKLEKKISNGHCKIEELGLELAQKCELAKYLAKQLGDI